MCMKINICKFASLGLMHENLGAQKYLHLQQKDKTGVQRKPDTDQIVTYRYKFSKKEGLHLFCSTPGLNHSISMNIIFQILWRQIMKANDHPMKIPAKIPTILRTLLKMREFLYTWHTTYWSWEFVFWLPASFCLLSPYSATSDPGGKARN